MKHNRVKSAVDLWLTLIMGLATVLIVFTLINSPKEDGPIGCYIGITILLFIIWIYFGTYYELRDDYLYRQSGPIRYKIKALLPFSQQVYFWLQNRFSHSNSQVF